MSVVACYNDQLRSVRGVVRLGFGAFVAACPAKAWAQVARADTLLGRVTGTQNDALLNADVIATRGPDRKVFRSRTAVDGRWTIVVDSGTGDYLIYVSAPGRMAVRRRVTRSATETYFTINVVLVESSAALLSPVEVRGTRRESVERDADGFGPPRGGAETSNDGVLGSISPGAQADLAGRVSSVPGVRSTRDGVSALGLPANQSLVTLNGLAFGLGELPRGVIGTSRVTTTAWDVARGGFSGVQVDANVPPGSEFSSRRLYVSADAPALQATDAAGGAIGQVYRRLDVNLAANGSLTRTDRFVYATAARLRTQQADVPSLLSSSAAALDAVGLPIGTGTGVATTAQAQGIPLGIGHGTSRTDVQFVGRLDRLNYDADTYAPVPRSYGAMAVLNLRAERGAGLGPTVLPSAATARRDVAGALQLVHSLMANHWLHESSASISLRDTKSTLSTTLPTGIVRFDNVVEDGALVGVALGGAASGAGTVRDTRLEVTQTSQAYLGPGTHHLLKLFGQVRLDGANDDVVPNALGTYEYASVSDFSEMRPSAFSRTLALPVRHGASWNGALGAGIVFRPSALFSLQYGLRIERSAFLTRPNANPGLLRALGVATDVAPTEFNVSPRLGFRWVYSRKPRDGGYLISTSYGTQATDVRGVLRGGFGEFRNYLDPHDVASVAAYTGIGTAQQHLRCIGDAVPVRTWRSFVDSPSSVPRACDGSPSFLADTAPDVRALAPTYRSPRSWRANVGWSTRALRTDIAVEGILSFNLAQPSSTDANFNGIARTTLDHEAFRPLFVRESSVVPATGNVSAVESRQSGAYGSAIVDGSNGRSTSAQLRVTLTPPAFLLRHLANTRASWILSRSRSRVNGFDGTTAGDPRDVAWAPGNGDIRHQIILETALDLGKNFGLTLFLNASSGLPYTPIVRGDVNGDGRTDNDRAFVTRGGSDSAAVSGMNRLIADPGSLRSRCLIRSLESIATANSCRGPWEARLNMQLVLPARWIPIGHNRRLNVFFDNPLGGLDQLVHGGAIRGWGAPAVPDPVLYAVRGFDPSARTFVYSVNPRFGATDARLTRLRSPFRATLDFQASFGPSDLEQLLGRALRNGRRGDSRARRSPKEIAALYSRTVPNQYAELLEIADSLLLTKEQVHKLETANAVYIARRDSAWLALGMELSQLGDTFDRSTAIQRQQAAIASVWNLARKEANGLDAVLNAVQLSMLPWPAGYLRRLAPGEQIVYEAR